MPFFSLLYLQRLPAFLRSCDAMAAAFQHFGAWTAPICNPCSLHPSRTPLSTASVVHPPPRRPLSLRSLHHQPPISTITVMISTITSVVTTVNTTVPCHLDKAAGPQDRGKEPKFSGIERKVQVDYTPENKERRLLERTGK